MIFLATTSDNPFDGVKNFFESSTFQALIKLGLFFVVVLWLALAFWTFKDAKRRIADPILVAVAVVTALIFPFVGAMVYAILRPPEYLEDVRERELEMQAAEARLQALDRSPTLTVYQNDAWAPMRVQLTRR